MTTGSCITLRPLLCADLRGVLALSASFGWPHRIEDLELMVELGRGVTAECEGELVGTAFCWTYGANRAALGMVGVAPRLQGQGLGRRLVQEVLAGLAGHTIVLHATEAGVRLYESLGFSATARIRQQQGASFRAGLVPLQVGERLRPIGRSDPEILAALDYEASGMDRRGLIAALLRAGTGVVLDRNGTATGFAVLRRFGIGQVIGPVVAPDAATARTLIAHFLMSNPGQFIRVDVPEKTGLCPWLQGLGLLDAGLAIRMVRGAESRPDLSGAESRADLSGAESRPDLSGAERCPNGRLPSFALASQAFG